MLGDASSVEALKLRVVDTLETVEAEVGGTSEKSLKLKWVIFEGSQPQGQAM
jgi:hypothetical protein